MNDAKIVVRSYFANSTNNYANDDYAIITYIKGHRLGPKINK